VKGTKQLGIPVGNWLSAEQGDRRRAQFICYESRHRSSGLDAHTMLWLRRLIAGSSERVHVLRGDADLQVFLRPQPAWLGWKVRIGCSDLIGGSIERVFKKAPVPPLEPQLAFANTALHALRRRLLQHVDQRLRSRRCGRLAIPDHLSGVDVFAIELLVGVIVGCQGGST
jgi:hypothetical protein